MRIILASSSPRRRQILELLGVAFAVIPPRYEEIPSLHRSIEKEVLDFAIGKVGSIARQYPQSIIIGSDTLIEIDGTKIGKPKSRRDAKNILRQLSGRTHLIYTSVVIADGLGGPGLSAVEKVFVKMRNYSDNDIERYLAYDESLDKAGAYSVQNRGSILIESLTGDYLAAVGLPLKPIAEYLQGSGVALPVDVNQLYRDKSFPNWRNF